MTSKDDDDAYVPDSWDKQRAGYLYHNGHKLLAERRAAEHVKKNPPKDTTPIFIVAFFGAALFLSVIATIRAGNMAELSRMEHEKALACMESGRDYVKGVCK
jgi:hypothetical protein